jgi:predicted nucleic acid-binding protein
MWPTPWAGHGNREAGPDAGRSRHQRAGDSAAGQPGAAELAEPTARELLRVLAYPKFRLQAADRERLLEDLLPWCESWSAAIPSSTHRVRDSHDQVFLDLALAAGTLVLVIGDADLLALREVARPLQILTPAELQAWLARAPDRTKP